MFHTSTRRDGIFTGHLLWFLIYANTQRNGISLGHLSWFLVYTRTQRISLKQLSSGISLEHLNVIVWEVVYCCCLLYFHWCSCICCSFSNRNFQIFLLQRANMFLDYFTDTRKPQFFDFQSKRQQNRTNCCKECMEISTVELEPTPVNESNLTFFLYFISALWAGIF